MSVRIISGIRRGAVLRTPDGDATRPLRDRIRQALFNILRPVIRGRRVLDAFAGSGAVGLEAVSNGAVHATLCDSSPAALEAIRANIAKLRFEESTRVLAGAMPQSAAKLPADARFDLLFLMPPYHSGLCGAVLESAAVLARCDAEAEAVCEIHAEEPWSAPVGWQETDRRDYGITRLAFLRRSMP